MKHKDFVKKYGNGDPHPAGDGMATPMVEALAEFMHDAWASWTLWMMDSWDNLHEESQERFQDRWKRQIKTAYKDLSESEKDSDRRLARQMLDVFNRVGNKFEEKFLDEPPEV